MVVKQIVVLVESVAAKMIQIVEHVVMPREADAINSQTDHTSAAATNSQIDHVSVAVVAVAMNSQSHKLTILKPYAIL